MKISKKGLCIRNVANTSLNNDKDRFDNRNLDIDRFINRLHISSPKIKDLIKTIDTLDKNDLENHETLYKHVIYTDNKKASSGVKLIATGLISNGFKNVYDSNLKIFSNLYENEFDNFALLSSGTVYNKPFPTTLKRNILKVFNNRSSNNNDNNMKYNNINGKNIRIIIIDQGYKEGIDLFDVKYVHLLEPLITDAEEKQVIGRGTRFCGQKGLIFNPNMGWPLHVFKYDIWLNDDLKRKYNSNTLNDLFISHSGIDLEKLSFSKEIELLTTYGAIDYELTRNIHDLNGNDDNLPEISNSLYFNYNRDNQTIDLAKSVLPPYLSTQTQNGGNDSLFLKARQYVRTNFTEYKWGKIQIQNKCEAKKKSRGVEFTPTQNFITSYFNSASPYKGLFLWHSVGTGKTCSAISIASTGFEPDNYTILWVTRHTLKSDIWKNMFLDVCSKDIRSKIKSGFKIPADATENPFKYISKNWIQPISYKQFSNMLSGKNDLSNIMIKRNGKDDMLSKTLVIIDEVHKLFSTDLPIIERPDYNIIKKMIRQSYAISKENSVRLLLMSATPYTNNPMDMIKFINLMKEYDMPESYESFSKEYLENGKFTQQGVVKYLDNISPYISYLNREKDIQQFAYPVYYQVNVDISEKNKNLQKEMEEHVEVLKSNIQKLKDIMKDNSIDEKEQVIENLEKHKVALQSAKEKLKNIKNGVLEDESQEYALEKCFTKI
jgi:superfamily II DNA or RNA helicase